MRSAVEPGETGGPVKDIPSAIDLRDPATALAWAERTRTSKPWRADCFATYRRLLEAECRTRGQALGVIELGCGPGDLALAMADSDAIAHLSLLDFSPAMQALAAAQLGPRAAIVDWLCRDFTLAGWADGLGPYDAVLCHQAAHEIRHKHKAVAWLRDVRGLLQAGGLLLISDQYWAPGRPLHPELFMSFDEQPAALQAAGFTSIELQWHREGTTLYSARA